MNRITLSFFVFLILGALFIISNEKLHLSDINELDSFGRLYFNWIASLIGNFKNIAGNVVLENWIPDSNSSISNSS